MKEFKRLLKEVKTFIVTEVWSAIKDIYTFLEVHWKGILKLVLTISRWLFAFGLLWIGLKILSNDFAGNFSLIERDSSTGTVKVGTFGINQVTHPIDGSDGYVHRIGASYLIDGTIIIEYDRSIWDLHLFKIGIGIRASESPKGELGSGISFSIMF